MSSLPSHVAQPSDLAALTKTLAPVAVQISYCAENALPFRVQWSSARGLVMFYGLTPDEAAREAQRALARGLVTVDQPVTEPSGESEYAEAVRGWIADVDEKRSESPRRPLLRIVRSRT